MNRITTLVAATMMALGLLASSALAGGHEWHEDVDPHPHVMLIGAELVPTEDGLTLTFRRCVELTSNASTSENGELPTPAHHHSIHTGKAGGSPFAPGALFNAGNWVVPLAPFHDVPFTGCESFTSGMPFG